MACPVLTKPISQEVERTPISMLEAARKGGEQQQALLPEDGRGPTDPATSSASHPLRYPDRPPGPSRMPSGLLQAIMFEPLDLPAGLTAAVSVFQGPTIVHTVTNLAKHPFMMPARLPLELPPFMITNPPGCPRYSKSQAN